MKKYLIILVGVISLLGVSSVKAETYTDTNKTWDYISDHHLYHLFQDSDFINIVNNCVDSLYQYYYDNYSSDYPYFVIGIDGLGFQNNYPNPTGSIVFQLNMFSSTFSINHSISNFDVTDNMFSGSLEYTYNFDTSSYDSSVHLSDNPRFLFDDMFNNTTDFSYYIYSNFSWVYFSSNYDTYITTDWHNHSGRECSDCTFEIRNNDIFPTLFDNLGIDSPLTLSLLQNSYTEVNLNDYSYVALSLKDYTERDEFYTNVEVQGQYCLTPVYDYGLKEKKDVITGSKNQGCSPYYENYTPVRTYILENDIKNHAIYYLKAHDTSRVNKVKVDTSIFNIHYITSEEASNPILNINGKKYSSIPYSELTDSATISEEEGYVSGASCAVGDFNCMSDYTGFKFSDIFTKPLDFFKDLWSSIAKVFELVAMLVSLLPTPIQYFFYISFTLAIIIGLIKIIL